MRASSLSSVTIGTILAGIFAIPAISENLNQQHSLFGFLDPQTGVFHPSRRAAPPASASPTTGTVDVTIQITIVSTLATGSKIDCLSTLFAEQIFTAGGDAYFDENETVTATVSGTTATCKVSIPYAWLLSSASTVETSFTGTYTVEASAPAKSTGIIERSSTGTFVSSTTIPASGTTSTYTVSVTL